MEAVPDDLLQHDLHTFPRDDPAVLAKQAQVNAAAERELKARAAAEAKERKQDEAMVKKALAPKTKAAPSDANVDTKAARRREMMAHKIRLYYKKLGHNLTSKEPKTLPKDEEGLAELLAAIETELHSKGGIDYASKLTVGGCAAFEQVTAAYNPLGLMISGPVASLTKTMEANRNEWDELVTEFAIANAEWFVVGPGKRLFGFMVHMIQVVDSVNKAAVRGERVVTPEERKAAEEL